MGSYTIDLMHRGQPTKFCDRYYEADSHKSAVVKYMKEMHKTLHSCSRESATCGVRMTAPGVLRRYFYKELDR